jgi:hypothetical protein
MSDALGGYRASTLLSASKHAPLTVSLTAHGQKLRLSKRPGESAEHLLLKALLWACVVPAHPDATCELDMGLRCREALEPDLFSDLSAHDR